MTVTKGFAIRENWESFLDHQKTLNPKFGLDDDEDSDGEDFEDSDDVGSNEYDRMVSQMRRSNLNSGDFDDSDSDQGYTTDESALDESKADSKTTLPSTTPDNLLVVPAKVSKKKKKRVPPGYYEFNSQSQVAGLIHMEIVKVTDLPPMSNMTRTGFDMDPFVVVSFGKKTFRTPPIRHTLNPVFNEKVMFPVLEHEKKYSINFAVLDKDKFTLNDDVASVDFKISDVLKVAMTPDPKTMLYDLDILGDRSRSSSVADINSQGADDKIQPLSSHQKNSSNEKSDVEINRLAEDDKSTTFELPLTLCDAKYQKKHSPKLYIKCRFLPYGALRQQFWRGLIKVFDTDKSGTMNFFEISELLETLGSTISEKTVLSYFSRFGKHVEDNELSVDELVMCLEDQVLKDTIEQQKKPKTTDQPALSPGNNSSPTLKFDDPEKQESADYIPDLDDDDSVPERMIQLSACPLCNQPRMSKRAELDIITHLATCSSQDWASNGRLVLEKFVTSNQARQRWYSKVVSKVTYGNYSLGANSANILVQDRVTGFIQEEKMNVYVRLGIRVLYKGIRSSKNMEARKTRSMLKNLSIKQGIKYDNPTSAEAIPAFIKFHQLNMDEVLEPLENFATFNEFFYRKLKPGARPVDAPEENRIVTSAADSRSTYFPTISKATEIWIKGREFSISRLFGDAYPQYVDRFLNGSLCIFRLAPQDYHRFHMPVSGVLGKPTTIEGEYYTVNPMAIRSSLDVYGENVRVLVPVESDEFGLVMMVCVGAMMVGSTVITAKEGDHLQRADELGYFQFGGSTVVVLFEPGRIKFDEDLVSNSNEALETLVSVGMSIGHAPEIPQFERNDAVRQEDIERAKVAIAGKA